MSIEWFLIIADIIDKMSEISGIVFVISFAILSIVGITFLIITNTDTLDEEIISRVLKTLKVFVWIAAISSFIYVLIPKKTTLYTIAGVHYSNQLNLKNNPLIEKSLKLLEQKLDEALLESSKESK